MGFFSVPDIFKGKQTEDKPTTPPLQSIEDKKAELASLEKMRTAGAQSGFRSPQTDSLDDQRINELRSAIENSEPKPTQAPEPTLNPVPGVNIENFPRPMQEANTTPPPQDEAKAA